MTSTSGPLSTDPNTQLYAKVNSKAFFAIQWTGAALALCFLGLRLGIRIRAFKKLQVDDYFVIFAWLILVANNILWHTQLFAVYKLYAAESNLVFGLFPTTDTINQVLTMLKALIAFNVFFNCCLWSIKASFLAFFYQLGNRSHHRKIWWWIVTVFTVCTFIACIGDFNWSCSLGSEIHIITYCTSPAAGRVEGIEFDVNTAFDLTTDVLIITIPIQLLWNVQISRNKKLALFGVFSLTILTMIFALIRLLVVPKGMIASDLTWSFTWSNIEMSVAIIVACLGSFRQLYISKHGSGSSSGGSSLLRRLLPFWSTRQSSSYRSADRQYSNSMQHLHQHSNSASALGGKSLQNNPYPPAQAIYVKDEFSFTSTVATHDRVGTRYPIPPV